MKYMLQLKGKNCGAGNKKWNSCIYVFETQIKYKYAERLNMKEWKKIMPTFSKRKLEDHIHITQIDFKERNTINDRDISKWWQFAGKLR